MQENELIFIALLSAHEASLIITIAVKQTAVGNLPAIVNRSRPGDKGNQFLKTITS
jgi:hypothetical protein